jgi:hypothetical protein
MTARIQEIEAMTDESKDWVLAPIEPTPEMLRAGAFSANMNHQHSPKLIAQYAYGAMLAARPQAPTAPAGVDERGWMPIETAPKDGTLVLLYCAKPIDRLYTSPEAAKHYCIGYYGDGGAYHVTSGWHTIESREEVWGYGSELTGPMSETENLSCDPTHWMPLPKAPEEK